MCLIRKKLEKGKSISEIADEVERNVDEVKWLIERHKIAHKNQTLLSLGEKNEE